jgi:hypothetical protein
VTRRQQSYFVFRGASAGLFLVSATLLPHGAPAVIGCLVGGLGGILTCIGVNAGGPGERAGARVERVVYDRSRAPQGEWPPFPVEKVVDGELHH